MHLQKAETMSASSSARTVGQAIHEIALTDALSRSASRLLPPGPGRSVIVIPEVAIGRGRPDILIVVVSMASLKSYLSSGLRIETLTQAKALVAASTSHGIKSSKTADESWTNAAIRQYSKAVIDSLAVEAKIKDWKQAIRQASRFRHLSNRAAIMLPGIALLNRVEPYLQTYDLGYIDFGRNTPAWCVPANKQDLQPENALWLLELAARETRARFPQSS